MGGMCVNMSTECVSMCMKTYGNVRTIARSSRVLFTVFWACYIKANCVGTTVCCSEIIPPCLPPYPRCGSCNPVKTESHWLEIWSGNSGFSCWTPDLPELKQISILWYQAPPCVADGCDRFNPVIAVALPDPFFLVSPSFLLHTFAVCVWDL